jgi:multiple sugar transport system substrate-binding protein
MYEEGGYLPTNKNIYRDQKFLNNNEEIIFFNNLLSSGVYRPFLEGYTYLSDIISYYLNIAIKSEMTVEKALEEAERKILAKEILVK